ncbi:hypothetical protein LTR78_001018 [Recurvomyces mirabilis]|uniref:CMP/dCMP-type deaminase domain-containing protein n=1 Tax=Recurvomyces mirabilis TaxID=574656 RepID=A0AAE0WW83_9PEZI|nr:hypothetical protein LTR78_001018 [Recurvomyces mirabilis]KAK5158990.1 hypothetical protein LTS14_003098 [Recurvomyces mirabilis]
MKTDNYLTLCLEQAAKSPLHYRHGAIVVRGGKVIGQGYNDYRPGFDGGALKHGRIAKGGLDGPAVAELKEKLKRQKGKPKCQQQQNESDFVAFEGTGGGHRANVPLSMHSEMMAIHSALAASSTLSSTAFACEKPCLKLSGCEKRKARLRAEVLKQFKSAVLKLPHLDQVVHHGDKCNNKEEEEDLEESKQALKRHERQGGVQHLFQGCHRGFHLPLSGEKHHLNQKRKNQNLKKEKKGGTIQGQYGRYQYGRYGSQIQLGSHGGQQGQPFVSERQRGKGLFDGDDGNDVYADDDGPKRKYDSTVHGVMTEVSREACVEVERSSGKGKKDYKRSGRMKAKLPAVQPQQSEVLLLLKGHISPSKTDRKKSPRLVGADLYVARLGWCKGNRDGKVELPTIPVANPAPSGATSAETETVESSSVSIDTSSSSATGCSLHDELTYSDPAPPASAPTTFAAQKQLDPSIIRASRPCYRCISYMHAVGVKRVFWTSDAGDWEGGKVRDLVDALDDSMESVMHGHNDGGGGGDNGIMGNGVFVTKHEVLMMKRRMGMKK